MKRSIWLGALVGPFVASIGYLAVMMLLPDSTPKDERSLEAAFVALVVFLLPVSYLASLSSACRWFMSFGVIRSCLFGRLYCLRLL